MSKETPPVITYLGKTQSIASWARELNVVYDLLRSRIQIGWEIKRAMEFPYKKRNRKRSKA